MILAPSQSDVLQVYPHHPNNVDGVSVYVRSMTADSALVILSDEDEQHEETLSLGDMIYLNNGTWVVSELHPESFGRRSEKFSKANPVIIFRKFVRNL